MSLISAWAKEQDIWVLWKNPKVIVWPMTFRREPFSWNGEGNGQRANHAIISHLYGLFYWMWISLKTLKSWKCNFGWTANIQSGNTDNMIFSVHFIIFYLSQFMRLEEGDLVLTSTPPGEGLLETERYSRTWNRTFGQTETNMPKCISLDVMFLKSYVCSCVFGIHNYNSIS